RSRAGSSSTCCGSCGRATGSTISRRAISSSTASSSCSKRRARTSRPITAFSPTSRTSSRARSSRATARSRPRRAFLEPALLEPSLLQAVEQLLCLGGLGAGLLRGDDLLEHRACPVAITRVLQRHGVVVLDVVRGRHRDGGLLEHRQTLWRVALLDQDPA